MDALPLSDDGAPNTSAASAPRPPSLVARFWRMARGFWGQEAPRGSWLLTVSLFATIVCVVAASYAMNVWNGPFSIVSRTGYTNAVARLSLIYFVILAVSVGLSMTQVTIRMAVQRRWRGC